MLIAASVMNSVSAWPGTSMTKTWLIRRAVRRPVAEAVTSRISSSVCRLPFISSSPLPSRISATACAAAAWLCGASTIWWPAMSRPCSRRDGADLCLRADQDRDDQSGLGRVERAAQRGLVAGMRDDRHRRDLLRGRPRSAGRTLRGLPISRSRRAYRTPWFFVHQEVFRVTPTGRPRCPGQHNPSP